MIPKIGQHVKCLLKTGVLAEGKVEIWNENEVQLLSLDEKSILIITHPTEDIMLIKLLLNKQSKIIDNIVIDNSIITEKENHSNNNDDRLKNLVALRKELVEQERRIISDKLKTHEASGAMKVKYEQPKFCKMPSAK